MLPPRPCWLIAISLTASLVGFSPFLLDAHTQSVQPQSTPKPSSVLQIPFEDQDGLKTLARQLDIWEVHYEPEGERGHVVALVDPAEQAWLAEGNPTTSIDPRSFHPAAIPDYPCYRTIDELYADLQTTHADHPGISELIDIGDSYEGRDIWALRITNRAIAGAKPILLLIANIHGRELITNEAAMALVDHLTDGYGVDPDATWLVDHHEIHVVVSANPDGHVKNEPGEPWTWWRKNANSAYCTGGQEGADLNRNSSFGWNSCPPEQGCSSSNECYPTYRGPSAASESETQAVEGYARTIFPDQRSDPLTATAPLTTSGVFITLHSYGNLVLWPWGMITDTVPNDAGLRALGERMAAYNGYTPKQASGYYPADGITDDYVYGALGVAAFTFEMGSSSDGFYPPCSRYDGLIQPNLPAFLYAAKVARTPYLTAHGPDAVNAAVSPAEVLAGDRVTLTATISDADNGGNAISAAECYVDAPPWADGAPTPMSAADGDFDGIGEPVTATLDTSGLSFGRHILFVRGRDGDGYWGPFTAAWLHVHPRRTYLPLVLQKGQ